MKAELNLWHIDDSGCLSMHLVTPKGERVHAWINRRPHYCDRGHWEFNLMGLHDIDGADRFPRYYVDLETAVKEAEAFLRWRIWQVSKHKGHGGSFLPYTARRFDP